MSRYNSILASAYALLTTRTKSMAGNYMPDQDVSTTGYIWDIGWHRDQVLDQAKSLQLHQSSGSPHDRRLSVCTDLTRNLSASLIYAFHSIRVTRVSLLASTTTRWYHGT